MKKFAFLLLLSVTVIGFYSCSKDSSTSSVPFGINQENLEFVDAGDTAYLNVNASESEQWTATISARWCSASLTKATGSQVLGIIAEENTLSTDRTATIVFKSSEGTKTLTIVQKGSAKLSTSVSELEFGASKVSKSVDVKCNISWKVQSSQKWCTASFSDTTGNASLAITCDYNLTELDRQASIVLTAGDLQQTIKVTQSGGSLVFSDDFTNNSNGWYTNLTVSRSDSILAYISNGAYVLNNQNITTEGNYYSLSIMPDVSSNYIIEYSVKSTYVRDYYSGIIQQAYGFIFGSANGAVVRLEFIKESDVWYANLTRNGVSITSAVASDYNNSDYNTVKIVKLGTSYDIYLNNTQIMTATISSLLGKYVGFIPWGGSTYYIDYLKVRKL